MKSENQAQLLPFYLGSLDEQKRLQTERNLLLDPELLVDYFDLKRKMDQAESIPVLQSQKVWLRLKDQIPQRRKWILTWALGLAMTACLGFLSMRFLFDHSTKKTQSTTEILIDSGSELPVTLNVL